MKYKTALVPTTALICVVRSIIFGADCLLLLKRARKQFHKKSMVTLYSSLLCGPWCFVNALKENWFENFRHQNMKIQRLPRTCQLMSMTPVRICFSRCTISICCIRTLACHAPSNRQIRSARHFGGASKRTKTRFRVRSRFLPRKDYHSLCWSPRQHFHERALCTRPANWRLLGFWVAHMTSALSTSRTRALGVRQSLVTGH